MVRELTHTIVQPRCKHNGSHDPDQCDVEDKLLIEAVATVQFGHLATSSPTPPPGGYPEEEVTEVLMLVS